MANTNLPDPNRAQDTTPDDVSPERADPVTEQHNDGGGDRREREMRKNLRDAEGKESIGPAASDDPDAVL